MIDLCPVCGLKLILKGNGWAFCDNCVCEIEANVNNNDMSLDDTGK